MPLTVRSSSASSTAEGVLRAYFEATLDCVVIADASGRVVEFDPAPERTFAYAWEALARRSAVPVELRLAVDGRLPTSIEIAADHLASKARANAAKHPRASLVPVVGNDAGCRLRLTIADDGAGGAVFRAGSGLTSLVDRVEALGGRLTLDRPPGPGTAILIELPLGPLRAAGIEAIPAGSTENLE
jgi:hypothetical protein